MRFFTSAPALGLALCFSLCPSPAYAWGPQGHAIVADIASDRLNRTARRQLQQILRGTDLASIASWADEIRPALPQADGWHYVNIPSGARGYDPSRDCPREDCVVAKIVFFSRILGDSHFPPAARLMALEFLVHLVGDIHQPFHALADARGGNDIPVEFFGSQICGGGACNLHRVWDTALLDRSGQTIRQSVRAIERDISRQHLSAGSDDPRAWANESFVLARNALVPSGSNLGQSYFSRERPVMDRQLALAGLRLARLLNDELGESPARSSPK